MSLFTKSVLVWLAACIILLSIERLISVLFFKKNKYRKDYSKLDKIIGKDGMIRINLIKKSEYFFTGA